MNLNKYITPKGKKRDYIKLREGKYYSIAYEYDSILKEIYIFRNYLFTDREQLINFLSAEQDTVNEFIVRHDNEPRDGTRYTYEETMKLAQTVSRATFFPMTHSSMIGETSITYINPEDLNSTKTIAGHPITWQESFIYSEEA